MASGYQAVNNCNYCKCQLSNGIIRDCKFYCSDKCYNNTKKVHFIQKPIYQPPTPVIEKQCNYCFSIFDRNTIAGIEYGPMWFCCQEHLNLANPRPKVMVAPHIVPHIVPHIIGPRIIGPRIIGPRIIGPHFGHHIIGPHFIGH